MIGQQAYHMNYPLQPQNYPQQSYQQFPQQIYPSVSSPQIPYQAPYAYPNQGYGHMPYVATGQYSNQAAYGYPAQNWNQPMQQQQSSPTQMGPPIRLGFDSGQNPQNQKPNSFQVPLQGKPSFDNKRKRDGQNDSRGTSNNVFYFLPCVCFPYNSCSYLLGAFPEG